MMNAHTCHTCIYSDLKFRLDLNMFSLVQGIGVECGEYVIETYNIHYTIPI